MIIYRCHPCIFHRDQQFFSAKKSILKDDTILTVLLQSETVFLFPEHFLGSRRTLENLFVHFERTLNGVVFDEKNFAGNHCAFAGDCLKHS